MTILEPPRLIPQEEKRTDWVQLARRVQEFGGTWCTVRYYPKATGAPFKGLHEAIEQKLKRAGCEAQVVVMAGRGQRDKERPWDGWLAFARARA